MAKKAAKKAAKPAEAQSFDSSEQLESSSILCPIPADPAMGDKTPAVMDWYREHAPKEYARRYDNRVTPHSGGQRHAAPRELGPVSDFEDEPDEVKKSKVIM